MKWDKKAILALVGIAGTFVSAALEIILSEIDRIKALEEGR